MRPIVKGSTDQSVIIRIIDATDGTPEQAVEHNTSGISLWYRREGATITAITPAALAALDTAHSDGGIEHIDDGYYRLDLPDAAVATGVNGVMIGGAVTGMVVIGCYVTLVDVNPYDGVRAGMTALPNAAADAAGGLPISDAGGLDLDAQIGTDIDAILVDTAVIGALGAGLTGIPWNAAWDAEVQSEVADALAVYDPPTNAEMEARTLVAANYATAAALTTVDNEIATIDGIVDSILEDTAAMPTAAGIADAVWDEAQADHVAAGSFGVTASEIADILVDTGTTIPGTITTIDNEIAVIDGIVDDILVDTAVIGAAGAGLTAVPWNAAWDAEVQSECTDALNAYDPPTNAEMEARTIVAANYATAAALATVDTEVGVIDGIVDSILEDTGTTIPASLTTIDNEIAVIDGIVDDILVDTGTTIPAAISGLNDLSAAEVNAEVVDALATDTYAEPGQGAPGATVALSAKIGYLYKAWRNKAETNGSTHKIYADDGTTVDQQATIGYADETFTRGEMGSGA